MRIVLANSTCKVGGVSTFLLSLRAELLSMGHSCELFFFEHGPMERHLPADCRAEFGSLADLLQKVSAGRVDVVHANNVDWPTGISAVRQAGARLVLTAHKVREPAWTYGWHAANCDAFVTVSAWIRDALQPFTDAAVHAVHNGIDTRRFFPGRARAEGPPIVAWVGRGSAERKRLAAFAAVAPALAAAGLRVWVIDSQGPDAFASNHPEAAAQLRSAAEDWRSVGFDQMPDLYRDVAASGGSIVSTASMEGLPLTLLEAQACGCLAIAADVQGVNECVSPAHGGVLYPIDAPSDRIARLIAGTLADRESVRARQAEAAAYVAARFSLRQMASRYVELYSGAPGPAVSDTKRRRRYSPLHDWRGYTDERLGVGHAQYEASRTLAARGDVQGAVAAARESMATAPTMYAHPRRFWHVLRLESRHRLTGRRAGPASFPHHSRIR